MSELIVREAVDDDGPTLSALVASVLEEYPGYGGHSDERPPLDRPASGFADRGGALWVVMRGEEAVGALGVYRRARDDEFALALIGLDKDSRGRGLAAALLAGAEAYTAAAGGERLGLWLDVRLGEAVDFLERHDFVREPGLKGRHDGSDALEARFVRTVTRPPSEALRDDGA